jgi:hypothetical protein
VTTHVPVHHAGLSGHHVYRDALIVIGAAILVLVLAAVLLTIRPFNATTTPTVTAAQSLVEFRAAERDDWSAGVTSETDSLIQFRAAERATP